MSDLHLLSPKGFRAGAVKAGIKTSGNLDVALLVCDTGATAAAMFTTNKVFAAPVKIGREHIRSETLRGVVVNAGNANACTGKQGERDAIAMCRIAAAELKCGAKEILPSSTGIIGHLLPMDKIETGIKGAFADLGDTVEHATRFGDAIMTTDTRRKLAVETVKIGGAKVTIAGVCKGAGMIGPKLGPPQATMLAYLTTDAQIASPVLRKLFNPAVTRSFNSVIVDDHQSTNDTAVILASGHAGAKINTPANAKKFLAALTHVCQFLAYQIAADGEGATKVVRIEVVNAKNEKDATIIARAIANSPLVKCAMNGNDPNWGRIVSAAGMTSAAFVPEKATLTLQQTVVYRKGKPLPFDAAAVSNSLGTPEVVARLDCGIGKSSSTVWTCDLSKEYVSINADYHT
jgi:glutamate N-acetyltransferase/amino-acid N-acetyltransferase